MNVAVRTLSTFDLWFVAYALDPFIGASWSVARLFQFFGSSSAGGTNPHDRRKAARKSAILAADEDADVTSANGVTLNGAPVSVCSAGPRSSSPA